MKRRRKKDREAAASEDVGEASEREEEASASSSAEGQASEEPSGEPAEGDASDDDEPAESDASDDDDDGDEEEGAEDATKPAANAPQDPSLWQILRDCYFTFDRRTLGFTRILLGFLLITDLFRRTWAWNEMFSNEGVLPAHLNLFRPQSWLAFSFVNAFATAAELRVFWVFSLLTFVCVLVGYKTRVAQCVSLLLVASMNGRVLQIENGGYVVYNLLLLWTCFLPMGDRFSVDAMIASLRRRREATEDDLNDRTDVVPADKLAPYVSLVGLAIMLQISAIYFFNVVHKTGPAWKNGTAVHYVLYVDRMVTPLIGVVRDYLPGWIEIFLTKFVLAAEAAIPVALLSPLGRVWARRLAIVMMNALHLGFGSVFVLGPFAWSLCVFSTVLFSSDDWDIAARTMRRKRRARVVFYDPDSGAALLACRVLKRLDHFELLTFRASKGLALGLAVEPTSGGARVTGALACADMIAALPLGPVIAWIPRLPGIRHALDALYSATASRGPSRVFGLRPEPALYVEPPPAPLRLTAKKGAHLVHEAAVALMLATAVNQAMVELWVINRRIKVGQPEPFRTLAQKLRFLQGWFMFSPNPVMDDGTIVVDAITVDGRHIDPFTGKEPNFDLLHAKSLGLSQIWCDYFNRMMKPENSGFRDAMKDYMYRLPERTGHPEDAIVSGEVYWVKDMNPKWGEHTSYAPDRSKLFEFQNVKARAQASGQAPPTTAPTPIPFPPPLPSAAPKQRTQSGQVIERPQ